MFGITLVIRHIEATYLRVSLLLPTMMFDQKHEQRITLKLHEKLKRNSNCVL